MPGCCCMPLLHNHLMDSCSYVRKNTLLAAKGGCICTPLTPPESATAMHCIYKDHQGQFTPWVAIFFVEHCCVYICHGCLRILWCRVVQRLHLRPTSTRMIMRYKVFVVVWLLSLVPRPLPDFILHPWKNREKAWDHCYIMDWKWWTQLVQTESMSRTNRVHHFGCEIKSRSGLGTRLMVTRSNFLCYHVF